MKAYKRICIADWSLAAENGYTFSISRGDECITTEPDDDGYVIVMSNYWVAVPVDNFAGEEVFTGEES